MSTVKFDGNSKVNRIYISFGDIVTIEPGVELETSIYGQISAGGLVTISDQAHDVPSPYEVGTDESFNVVASISDQTVDADIYVLIGTNRFSMTYNSGTGKWETIIAASIIGIVSDVDVNVCVSDKNKGDMETCPFPITIVAPDVAEVEPLVTTLTLEKVPVDIELVCLQMVEATLTLEEE